MNCNVYIFGELSSGYTQYPEDGSSHVLKKLYPFCKTQSQIVVSRDAGMMYYCYIRKLNDNKYIGLCVAVNGYYITHVDELFALFESTIEKIAQHGTFIHFAKDGTLTTSTKILNQEEEEIDTLSENLRLGFEELGNSTNILPPVDYTVAKNSIKEFTDLDDKRDIVRASYTYGYTFIYKDKDFDTVRMNSYRSILKQLNDENNSLRKRNGDLEEQNAKILRQKKQFKNVVLLVILVIGCVLGIYFLYNDLNNTQSRLDEANQTISSKDNVIDDKNKRISIIRDSVFSYQNLYNAEYNKRVEVEDSLLEIKSKINTYYPFIVTSLSINGNSFNFDYYATETKDLTVTLKAINEETSQVISNTHTLTFYKGGGTKSLYYLRNLNYSYNYTVVLICGGKIISGGRW